MAKKKDDAFNEYVGKSDRVEFRQHPKPTHNQSLSDLISEGNRLLQEEEKKNPIAKSSPKNENNPYIRARAEVLKKMPSWKRNEIATMEKEHNLDNPYYDDFVKQVRILGDSFN